MATINEIKQNITDSLEQHFEIITTLDNVCYLLRKLKYYPDLSVSRPEECQSLNRKPLQMKMSVQTFQVLVHSKPSAQGPDQEVHYDFYVNPFSGTLIKGRPEHSSIELNERKGILIIPEGKRPSDKSVLSYAISSLDDTSIIENLELRREKIIVHCVADANKVWEHL